MGSSKARETAYTTIVKPSVEYASCAWDPFPAYRLNGTEICKNRFNKRSSDSDMTENLKWKSLQDHRRETRLPMLFKINSNLVAIKDHHLRKPNWTSMKSRQQTFQIPKSSATYNLQSFIPRTIREWNKLPPDIVSAGSVDAFKAQLATYFLYNPPYFYFAINCTYFHLLLCVSLSLIQLVECGQY